jgi:hypothetical protein
VIDSVALTWGAVRASSLPRIARGVAETLADPVRVDLDEVADRLGREHGQVRAQEHNGRLKCYGHWTRGAVEIMCGHSGRLELRCSLPKLLLGRNDMLLSQGGVHEALRRLCEVGSDAIGVPLELREAVPTRLDLCHQWQVPSVAEALERIKAGYAPARKKRTETVAARGGRSLVYGYGSKRVLRFYDKAAEVREHREDSGYEIDTLLRFEIQERRRDVTRLIHESGYRAIDIREHLQQALDPLATLAVGSLESYLTAAVEAGNRISVALGHLYLAQHPSAWPIVRKLLSKSGYYQLKARARGAAIQVAPWMPVVPEDAFDDAVPGLWEIGP